MMNDDQYLLASAYADGEVTPAERALAEADPAVMAEVGRLQALRGALREVEPSADAARAAMIAGAMREFHAATAAAPEPARRATPTVVTSRRPSRWFTWERAAGLAAAAVAVVAIGAVVANGTRGGGDDDSASIDMAEAPAMVTDAAGGAEAPAMLDAPADQDLAHEAAPADTLAAASTEAPAVVAAPVDGADHADDGTSAPAGSPRSFDVIESPEELAAAGLELRDANAAESAEGDGTVGTTPTTTECTFTAAVESPVAIPEAEQLRDELPELAERVELLDLRQYRIGPDDDRPAWIAVDLETGRAFAIEAVGCSLLAVGPLP